MKYLLWLPLVLTLPIGIVFGGYFFERHVTSNLQRDLSLNSGRRESSELINPEVYAYSGVALPQAEINALFTGDTPATYCIGIDGTFFF